MTPYEQALCDSGDKKLPVNRKKPAAQPGSGRCKDLQKPVEGDGRKIG